MQAHAHPRRNEVDAQAGFTLIELLIAMVVTLIITGAMYGLLAGGQNAFRREPELTDRQQAIRLGMDRLQRETTQAGERLGVDSQVFTEGLNAAGIDGPTGATDILEFISAPPTCPDLWVDHTPLPQAEGGWLGQGNSVNLLITQAPPNCLRVPGLMLLQYENGATKKAWAHNVPSDDRINMNLGQQPSISGMQDRDDRRCGQAKSVDETGGNCAEASDPRQAFGLQIVRYMIWPDTDGIPGLWRSETGGLDSGANYVDPPAAAGNWRLIARGVEDLQVQYRSDPANLTAWNDDPGTVVAGNTDTVVREVRLVLGARTVATNLTGAREAESGLVEDAVRGELEATVSPRAALFNLGRLDVWH